MLFEDEFDKNMKKTPVQNFGFSPRKFSLKEFVEHFEKKLPLMVKIHGGFCSPDEGNFSFSDDEVYWVTHILRQKRFLGKTDDDLSISIPYDHDMQFTAYKMNGKATGPVKMTRVFELMEETMMNYITAVHEKQMTVWQGAEIMKEISITKLTPSDVYDDIYLVGNPIIRDYLIAAQVSIPVFIPIDLLIANQLKDKQKTSKEFQLEIKRIADFTCDVGNGEATGNPEIMVFTPQQVENVNSSLYQFVNPYASLDEIFTRDSHRYSLLSKNPDTNTDLSTRKVPNVPLLNDHPIIRQTSLDRKLQTTKGDYEYTEVVDNGREQSVVLIDSKIARPDTGDYTDLSQSLMLPPPSGANRTICTTKPDKFISISDRASIPAQFKLINIQNTETKNDEIKPEMKLSMKPEVDYEYNEQFDVYEELGEVPQNIDYQKSTVKDVLAMLRLLKLHKYINLFEENEIDGVMLMELDKDLLVTDFCFSRIEAIKLWKFVHEGWRSKKH